MPAGDVVVSLAQRIDLEDERQVRMVWSRVSEPGDTDVHRLVTERGVVPALGEVLSGSPRTARWRVRLEGVDPARDLRMITRLGGRVVVPGDAEWPRGLDDLGAGAPFCLWARGPRAVAETVGGSVAVVGARAATAYGEYVAGDLGAGLAERGITVVSGAAYGIDGAAHRGAMAAAGRTVAVLACGVDRVYPQGHRRLIESMAAEHLVLAEVPPGSAPTRWRFLERNRLIAALTVLTVVVEAGHRSGALSTAGRAERLCRTVAAVPGPVTSPASAGCHRLLRDGATCVTDAAEVLELVAPMGECLVPRPATPTADHDGLPPADIRLLDALPPRRGVPLEALARGAALTEEEVQAGLGRLQVRGLVRREGSRWRRAPASAPPPVERGPGGGSCCGVGA